jgi:RND family efflux transporter MFP subunit
VSFRRVTTGTLQARIAASGSIEARRMTEIGSEVSGRLIEVFVDVGDWVEAEVPLFQIDPAPYETALAEARAGLALALAESENARLEEQRASQLAEQRVASQQDYDALRTQARVASARVQQMRAQVARAERDLERTRVISPYAGSIVERRAHEGALAGPAAIVVLQESGVLEAILDVPEASPIPVRVGDLIHLHPQGATEPLEVRVTSVNDRVDPETRTYEIRGPVSSPDLKAGSYIGADIFPSRMEPHPVVDRSSLITLDGRYYVFRLAGDRIKRVAVQVGVFSEDRVEILAGLKVGDAVALGDVVSHLSDGEQVIPSFVEPELATAQPTPGDGP